MAKTYQLELKTFSQNLWNGVAHSILFADSITPIASATPDTNVDATSIVVTSNVESDSTGFGTDYRVLADDSQSEVSIDIATGKFVEGNIIAGIASLAEIQSDVRNYVCYEIAGTDLKMFVGVASTTQSQDYTPDIIANSRVIKMLTSAQVKSLGL